MRITEVKKKLKEIDYDTARLTKAEYESFERYTFLKSRIGTVVKHFSGKQSLIIDIVEHAVTGEEMIVYHELGGFFKTYVMPIDMFLAKVNRDKHPEATQEYIFEFCQYSAL